MAIIHSPWCLCIYAFLDLNILCAVSRWPEAKFLDKIQTSFKEFSSLLFSHFHSFALRFLILQTHATSYFTLLHIVKKKGGKPNREPHPLPYGFSTLCLETSTKLYVHEFSFRTGLAVWFNISAKKRVKLNSPLIQQTEITRFFSLISFQTYAL
jgi:hypothetical protein